MKKSTLTLVTTAAILAAVIGWSLRPRGTVESSSSPVAARQSEPPAEGIGPASIVDPKSAPGTEVTARPLQKVTRLSDLSRMANRSDPQPGQAYSELLQGIAACESIAVQVNYPSAAALQNRKTPRGKQQYEASRHFLSQFCDNPGLTADQYRQKGLEELGASDLVVQASMLAPGGTTASDAVDAAVVERLASQVDSPAALQRASEYLIDRGQEIPAMKQVPRPPSVSSQTERASAQRLAVMMVTCDVRGGCGPGGLYTVLWCGACEPGSTLEQSWQQQYAPDTIAYARAVAAKLLASGGSSK